MSFESLLDNLLDAVDGAIATALFDAEGEVVQSVRREGMDPQVIRLMGAYECIFHRGIDDVLDLSSVGRSEFNISEYSRAVVITMPLVDGYFLLLYGEASCNIGQGLMRLRLVRPHILEEM